MGDEHMSLGRDVEFLSTRASARIFKLTVESWASVFLAQVGIKVVLQHNQTQPHSNSNSLCARRDTQLLKNR